MVSKLLISTEKSAEEISPLIKGCVGVGIGVEFCSWCKAYASLPSMKDIFSGKRVAVPTDTDVLYALVSAMTAYAREHKSDMSAIANSISFAMEMPPDFAAVLLKNYTSIEPGFKEKLMKIPDFYKFISKKGRLLNGI